MPLKVYPLLSFIIFFAECVHYNTTNIIDISWFDHVSPRKESMAETLILNTSSYLLKWTAGCITMLSETAFCQMKFLMKFLMQKTFSPFQHSVKSLWFTTRETLKWNVSPYLLKWTADYIWNALYHAYFPLGWETLFITAHNLSM